MSDPLGLLLPTTNSAPDPLGLLEQGPRVPAWMPTADREFQLRQGKPDDRSFIGDLWDRFATDNEADRAKAANATAIAEMTGMPPSVAYENMDQVSQQLGMRDQPTFRELIEKPMMGAVVAGLLTHPLATVVGVTSFGLLAEAENYLVSRQKSEPYQFGAGKGLADLLPEESDQRIKDVIWTADMAWKAVAAGGAIKVSKPAAEQFAMKYMRDVTETYGLARNVYISPEKVKAHYGGKGSVPGEPGYGIVSPEETAILKDLGLSHKQYAEATRNGIDLEIAADKLVTIVDKPWWAAMKGYFKASPYAETKIVPGETTIKTGGEGAAKVPAATKAEPSGVEPQKLLPGPEPAKVEGDAFVSPKKVAPLTEQSPGEALPTKIIDESGKPLVVYHGTDREFSVFDDSIKGDYLPSTHLGIFFSDNIPRAEYFAKGGIKANRKDGKVLSATLDITNPYEMPFSEKNKLEGLSVDEVKAFRAKLIEDGYDGIVVYDSMPAPGSELPRGIISEIIAFRPDQVKNVKVVGKESDVSAPSIAAKAEGPPVKTISYKSLSGVPVPLSGYPGNKATMLRAEAYDGIIPEDFPYKRIVEPFGGSGLLGNAISAGQKVKRVLNDLDSDVINFHEVAKTNVQGLADSLMQLDAGIQAIKAKYPEGGLRVVHDEVIQWWKDQAAAAEAGDPVTKAAWFALRNSGATGRSWHVGGPNQGLISGWTGDRFIEWNIKAVSIPNIIKRIKAHSAGLKKVDLRNEDARAILAMAGEGDLVPVDPPYVQFAEKTSKILDYKEGKDLTTLSGAINFINEDVMAAVERGATIIYTNNAVPEIVAALKANGFSGKLLSVQSRQSGGKSGRRNEVIAWNERPGRQAPDAGQWYDPEGILQGLSGADVAVPGGGGPGQMAAGDAGSEGLSGQDVSATINDLFEMAARSDQAVGPPATSEYDKIRAEAAKLAFETINKKLDLSKRKLMRETARVARDEARLDPVYVAMQEAIRLGGINRDKLSRIYDKDTVTELVRKRIGLVTNEGKYGLDEIADMTGFESDDALMSAMLDWQGLGGESGKIVAQYEERYGDLLNKAELEDFHLNLLGEEAKILRKMLGQSRKPSALGIKKVIQEQTGQTRVDELMISEYEALKAGMVKAEIASRKAFRAGNIEGTLAEKERQIEMAQSRREKLLAKEEANKIHDGILALTKDKNIPEDYQDQIADLLEDYDLLPRSNRTAQRVESAREFIERQKESGEDVTIPESMLNRIERYGKTHWRELTLDQLREIYDQAQMYAHLGKLKNKLIAAKEAREFEDVVETIVSEIGKNWGVKRVAPEEMEGIFVEPSMLEKLGGFKESYLASLTKVETYLRRLDGFKDLGPIWEQVYLPVKRASDVEYTRLAEITDQLKALFDPLRDTLTKEKFRIPGVPQFLTRETVIMVALNSGNEGNLAALRENKVYNWTDEQIQTILKNVTPEEWALVRGVWDLFETQYPDLAQVYKNLSGTTLKKVEGDYFPLVFDRKLSWIADRNATEKELRDFFQSIYSLPSVKSGSTIQRVGGTLPPKLKFQVIFEKLAEVNHYITHAEAVRDVQKVLADPRVRAAIEGAPSGIGGPEAFREMRSWLQDVARQQADPLSAVESALKTVRLNATTVALAWKFSTAAMQFLGATNSIYKVGGLEFTKGLAEFYTNREAMVEKIKGMSPEIAGRAKSFDRELRDAYVRIGLEHFRGSQAMKDSYFSLISTMDMAIAYPTWHAAYNKGMKDFAGDESKTIEYADMTTRMTQGNALVKDLAGIQRGAEMKKILSLFYTYFSAYHQMMGDSWLKFKFDKSGANMWDLMKAWWWLTILPATIEYLLKERDVPTPGKLIANVLQQRLTAYPVIRDITGAALTDFDYTFSPVAKAGEVVAKTGKEIVAAVDPDDEVEWDKLMRYSVESAGYVFGLPTGQASVTMQGIMDLKNGETSDLTRLLMRAPREER